MLGFVQSPPGPAFDTKAPFAVMSGLPLGITGGFRNAMSGTVAEADGLHQKYSKPVVLPLSGLTGVRGSRMVNPP